MQNKAYTLLVTCTRHRPCFHFPFVDVGLSKLRPQMSLITSVSLGALAVRVTGSDPAEHLERGPDSPFLRVLVFLGPLLYPDLHLCSTVSPV